MRFRIVPLSVSVMVTAAPRMAAPVESVTVPRMRPLTVWAKTGTDPSTNATITPSTRMLFDRERITEPPTTEWKLVVRQLYHHTKMDVKEFWGFWVYLTGPWASVVLWSDQFCARMRATDILDTCQIYLSDWLKD